MIKTISKNEIKPENITSFDVYGASSPNPNDLKLAYGKIYNIKIPINELGIDFSSIDKGECEGCRPFLFLLSDDGFNYLAIKSPIFSDIIIDYKDISLERELKINQIL